MAERYFRPQQFTEYQSDYAGPITPAFAQTAGKLQQRYDDATAQEDQLISSLENISALDFDADQEYKRRLIDNYKSRIEQRAKSGDFENQGRLIKQDALSFVKAAQPLAQRMKQYEDYQSQVRDNEDIHEITRQGRLKQGDILNRHAGLKNPDAGFVNEAFNPLDLRGSVKDVNEGERALEIGKMMKADKFKAGKWREGKDGIYEKTTSGWEKLTPAKIRAGVMQAMAADSELGGSLGQRAEMHALLNGGDPTEYMAGLTEQAVKGAVGVHQFQSREFDHDIKWEPGTGTRANADFMSGPVDYVQIMTDPTQAVTQAKDAVANHRTRELGSDSYSIAVGLATYGGTPGQDTKRIQAEFDRRKNVLSEYAAKYPELKHKISNMLHDEDPKIREAAGRLDALRLAAPPQGDSESHAEYSKRIEDADNGIVASMIRPMQVADVLTPKAALSVKDNLFGHADKEGNRSGGGRIVYGKFGVLENGSGMPGKEMNYEDFLETHDISRADFEKNAEITGLAAPNGIANGGLTLTYKDANTFSADKTFTVVVSNTVPSIEGKYKVFANAEKGLNDQVRAGHFKSVPNESGATVLEANHSTGEFVQIPIGQDETGEPILAAGKLGMTTRIDPVTQESTRSYTIETDDGQVHSLPMSFVQDIIMRGQADDLQGVQQNKIK